MILSLEKKGQRAWRQFEEVREAVFVAPLRALKPAEAEVLTSTVCHQSSSSDLKAGT